MSAKSINSDYITEIDYLHGYSPDLSPARIRLAMLKAGFAAPTFSTACELGYGYGDSIVVNAASASTNWFGTDLNSRQVESARELAGNSGISVSLFDESIEDFVGRRDLPEFDLIGMNGVWSWISPDARLAVVEFARKRLKVGGIFYVSYNTLPGWAPLLPLRRLLVDHAGSSADRQAPILERAEAAIAFAEKLLAVDPGYAADNPSVVSQLRRIKAQNRRYIVHEYFNRYFCPMHFTDAAALLSSAGLTFVGSANIGSLDAVYLTRPQRKLLESVDDPNFRELVRDMITDQTFRRDYWVKGPIVPLAKAERIDLAREVKIVAAAPRPALHSKLRMALALNADNLGEEIYQPILEMLATYQPVSIGDILSALKASDSSIDRILDIAMLLIHQEQANLALVPSDIVAMRPIAKKLNDFLLRELESGRGRDYMISPVTGIGLPVSRVHQAFLLALRQGSEQPRALAEAAGHLRHTLDAPGTPEALVGHGSQNILDQAHLFVEDHVPLLKALEVI